ncbi:Major facilitator superfamily MFS_1 OS=Tsukamurella paurometabola (strain ATCC 8368 / DSM /CCUG 35730 / CIP 100753 / JCM 10117 / KCTC 9821 / NBRC 16120/ NCIMB 702349 / NCTC 13040) OX=521096 GN=Tpau_2854 PE=4 SV=1 [Tsukamurella paurometabola]|uniref:Major facilitator superfamily MFS_1 n=2 Tax=Tsukamurella paurometabola TaxID=2061 RepID=D5UTG7_TSUPD|nr:major facilitator superfamily MFS_1 [Tsukamurella paurometabola DSM 20162]SUP35810.1 D-galactarate permease [Tsukamurella paurometabola]
MEMSAARRWWILAVSMTAAITTTATVNCTAFLLPQLIRDGLSPQRAGVFAAAAPAGLLLTTILWGAMIDRYGERRVLLVSLASATAGLAGTVAAFAAHLPLPMVAIGLFVSSAMAASGNGASGRIVVGWFPASSRGTAMGIRQTSQPLGIAILSLTMPLLANRVGLTAAMTVPLVVAAVSLILVWAFIVDPPRPESGAAAIEARTNPYREDSFLARIHAVSLLLVLPQGAIWTWGITWLIVGLNWAPATAGLLVSASQLCGALGRIAAGAWSDRLGSRTAPIKWIALGAAAAMGALGALTAVGSPIAVAVFLIASVVTVADNGLAFTAIAEKAGPYYSGRALGIQNTGQFIVTTAAGPVLGTLIHATGFAAAFAIVALAPLIAYPLVPSDAKPADVPEHPEAAPSTPTT